MHCGSEGSGYQADMYCCVPCSAIALGALRTFTLWQGPPGTGKTRTLLALVEVGTSAACC